MNTEAMSESTKILAHDMRNEIHYMTSLLYVVQNKIERGEDMASEVQNFFTVLKKRLKNINSYLLGYLDMKSEINTKEFFEKNIQEYQADFDLNIKYQGQQDFIFKANSGRFSSFIKNVLKNAQEAGATEVKLHQSKNYLVIKDNGSGFTKEALAKIKLGEQVTTKPQGSGVGVLSMKDFCLKNGLSLEISNQTTTDGASLVLKKNDSS